MSAINWDCFGLGEEFKQEKNYFYQVCCGSEPVEAEVTLMITYRQTADSFNLAQRNFNFHQSVENKDALESAKEDFRTARRAVIDYCLQKSGQDTFVDPDLEQ